MDDKANVSRWSGPGGSGEGGTMLADNHTSSNSVQTSTCSLLLNRQIYDFQIRRLLTDSKSVELSDQPVAGWKLRNRYHGEVGCFSL